MNAEIRPTEQHDAVSVLSSDLPGCEPVPQQESGANKTLDQAFCVSPVPPSCPHSPGSFLCVAFWIERPLAAEGGDSQDTSTPSKPCMRKRVGQHWGPALSSLLTRAFGEICQLSSGKNYVAPGSLKGPAGKLRLKWPVLSHH